MRKIIFYFFLLGIAINFLGCVNTVEGVANTVKGVANTVKGAAKGVEEDAKQNWKTLKKWDKEFQEKYW